jgi:predicted phosphodiesterase
MANRHGAVSRCAVIGDIHASDQALAAALAQIARLDVDTVFFTGDIVDGSGSVERCCALLRQHGALGVRGNHDRWLFTGLLRDGPDATRLEALTAAARAYVHDLPPTRDIAITGALPGASPAAINGAPHGGRMLLCHGIGAHDLERVTRYDTGYSLEHHQALREVIDAGYRLMVHGHTHDRLVTRVGAFVIVNAGAIHVEHEAGFLVLDFPANTMTWHPLDEIAGAREEIRIFL